MQEGDVVLLHSSEAFVKSEFTQINYVWDTQMRSMLGNKYKVLPKFIAKNDPEVIALPSPDGSRNGPFLDGSRADIGQWYFPTSVITKIGTHILLS